MPLGAINHHCVPRVVVDGDLAVMVIVSARAGRVSLIDHNVIDVGRHHLRSTILGCGVSWALSKQIVDAG